MTGDWASQRGMSYKDAGVDKEAGYDHVNRLKDMVASTHSEAVLGGIGSFGSLYRLGQYRDPVLVSGTDGVGTKLRVAFTNEVYDTVGIDLVAMCANDILVHGAHPLFFLDYLACSQLDPDISAQLVAGIVAGCHQAGASLIGGETAEMPGFYASGDYDMAGFCVGVVEREEIIDGSAITQGDVLLALSSTGLHSNGFSLVRQLFAEEIATTGRYPEELLTPTRIYVPEVTRLLEAGIRPHGLAHITGGGLIENVPRMLPAGLTAEIYRERIALPPVYARPEFQRVSPQEMWGTFNMGVGMVLAMRAHDAEAVRTVLPESFLIGQVTADPETQPWLEAEGIRLI